MESAATHSEASKEEVARAQVWGYLGIRPTILGALILILFSPDRLWFCSRVEQYTHKKMWDHRKKNSMFSILGIISSKVFYETILLKKNLLCFVSWWKKMYGVYGVVWYTIFASFWIVVVVFVIENISIGNHCKQKCLWFSSLLFETTLPNKLNKYKSCMVVLRCI